MSSKKNVDMSEFVADFYSVYQQNKESGVTLVKEYAKHFELTEVELIIANQRHVAVNMKEEANIFSPMKLAFFMLVIVAGIGNFVMMDNSTLIYILLFVGIFIPAFDSHAMLHRYLAHKCFADIVEAELPFFREYRKHVELQELDKLAEGKSSKSNADLF